MTGNHRVDDNPAERERVIASGGEQLFPGGANPRTNPIPRRLNQKP